MGCDWVGEVNEVKRHADCCPRRPWRCQYCAFTSLFDFGELHMEECTKYPVPCPNKCAIGSVARCDIQKHLCECPLELVACEFSDVGCNLKIARQDIDQHMKENQQQHMLLITYLNLDLTKEAVMGKDRQIAEKDRQLSEKDSQLIEKDLLLIRKLAEKDREITMKDKSIAEHEGRISQLQKALEKSQEGQIVRRDDIIAKMEKQLSELQETIEKLQNGVMKSTNHILSLTSHDFALDDFSECQWDGPNGDWFSEPFYTHPDGYELVLNVETKQDDAFMRVYLKLYKSDRRCHWPVTFTVALQLLNRADKFNHYLRWFECTFKRNPGAFKFSDPWKFIRFTNLHKKDRTTQYIDDDSLQFRLWIKINNY